MNKAGEIGPIVVRDLGIMGGRPIFRGTRVPVEAVFENLVEGHSLDEIIYNFPTLDRDDVQAALLQACEAMKASASEVVAGSRGEAVRALVSG